MPGSYFSVKQQGNLKERSMAQEIVRIAQASPELLVFLALAAGYFIGKIKIKGFGLGTTASVLIAAMALGLNVFIACIGLASGKQAVAVLQASAINVFAAGVVVALAPIVVGVLFGKFLLRMNPVLLLGALTGARVTSAAWGKPSLSELAWRIEKNLM